MCNGILFTFDIFGRNAPDEFPTVWVAGWLIILKG